MKYKNPPVPKDIVGFDLYINWDEPLILCEGVFDAIAIKNNSLPLFGKTILPKLKEKIIENRVRHIYIALDNDAFKDSLKIISDFIDMGIDVNFINLNVSDPSELGYDKMISKIDTSKEMNFKNLMELKLYGNKQKHMEIR